MKIGELAKTAKVSARMLRYYEEQGLITPDRAANGYRDYSDCLVDDVWQIRGLLDAGLPIKIIKQILPALDHPCTIHVRTASPEMIAALEEELERIEDRLSCLSKSRDAISEYLQAARDVAVKEPEVR
jgi:DNA-binding transcriptional MerR regulator